MLLVIVIAFFFFGGWEGGKDDTILGAHSGDPSLLRNAQRREGNSYDLRCIPLMKWYGGGVADPDIHDLSNEWALTNEGVYGSGFRVYRV